MTNKHLLSIKDLSREEIEEIFRTSEKIKADPDGYRTSLQGKTLGMIFQKSSTRTRVSFEVGMFQLGGHALYLGAGDMQLGRGETVPDTARVLSRYVDGIMARTFAHQDVLDLAEYGTVPVINGLTDLLHPCQVLADFFTIREHLGAEAKVTMAYMGDGNNMAHSLMFIAAKLGADIRIITPPDYEPDEAIVASAREDGLATGCEIMVTTDPDQGLPGANVVYTDVWASMGQEKEYKERKRLFADYQINLAAFEKATDDAIFMHCLPAHRGDEVTDEVADHPRSVIFDEAENRLHVQKAVMYLLMG
jgi:ornithine carbamoyltransferase